MTRLRVPDRVAVCRIDDVLYVAAVPDGPIHVLHGVAALIWEESLAGSRGDLVARVAAATDASAEEVAKDVDVFVDGLLERGLLIELG